MANSPVTRFFKARYQEPKDLRRFLEKKLKFDPEEIKFTITQHEGIRAELPKDLTAEEFTQAIAALIEAGQRRKNGLPASSSEDEDEHDDEAEAK